MLYSPQLEEGYNTQQQTNSLQKLGCLALKSRLDPITLWTVPANVHIMYTVLSVRKATRVTVQQQQTNSLKKLGCLALSY